jgi:RNA polymerase sigma-70 factor (ECF subfamily)
LDVHSEFLKRFLQHESDLKAFIGSLVRDPHARDDLFQDVALVLWEKYSSYDPARSFGAWARGIAGKRIMQRWEREGRVPLPFSPRSIEAIADAYERTASSAFDRAGALELCLERLPRRSRHLLTLRYEESLTLNEIAVRLGGTLDAVHKALSRIRSRLQECVQKRLASQWSM